MLNCFNFFQWFYCDFISITPNPKGQPDEFIINMKKGRKAETMKFASDLRADILTEALVMLNISLSVVYFENLGKSFKLLLNCYFII